MYNFAPKGSTVTINSPWGTSGFSTIWQAGSQTTYVVSELDVLRVAQGTTYSIIEDADSYDISFSNGSNVSIMKSYYHAETAQTVTITGSVAGSIEFF